MTHEPNLEELRQSGALDGQGGSPLWSRSSYIRHAHNTSLWEIILGLFTLGMMALALVMFLLRSFGLG